MYILIVRYEFWKYQKIERYSFSSIFKAKEVEIGKIIVWGPVDRIGSQKDLRKESADASKLRSSDTFSWVRTRRSVLLRQQSVWIFWWYYFAIVCFNWLWLNWLRYWFSGGFCRLLHLLLFWLALKINDPCSKYFGLIGFLMTPSFLFLIQWTKNGKCHVKRLYNFAIVIRYLFSELVRI